MNHTERQERTGIPFVVRIRTYRPHALTMLVATVAYLIVLLFVAGSAVGSASELRRANNAPHNEVVFAKAPNGEECFIYLNNYSVSGETRKNAVSDILMVSPETDYQSNNISFAGTLESGTCAVSANIAAKYGLGIGDKARVLGTDKTFTVVKLLPAQKGLDEAYLHEGVVVLSYDKTLLNRNFKYISFMTDGDEYNELDDLVYVKDMKTESIVDLLISTAIVTLTVAASMVISERFIFRRRRQDYKTLCRLGAGARWLYMRIFAESLLRYVLPAIILLEIFAVRYVSYTSAFYIPAACFVAACTVFSAMYSFIIVRRLYHVKSK